MSSETFTYKGISAGKYIEGEIEALNQEEASYKLLVSNDALPSKSLSCDKEFSELSFSGKLSILSFSKFIISKLSFIFPSKYLKVFLIFL